ncbi:MAG: motif protein [Lacunisphaera sp.]|nr:motif protein [Lacunisphaera sp.]
MKRVLSLVLGAVTLLSVLTADANVTFWTGIGNGWKNQIPPPNDGTADLVFGDNVSTKIPLPSPTFSINTASFTTDNTFIFVPQSGSTTLSIANGLVAANSFGGFTSIDFDANITVDLAGMQTWDLGSGGGNIIVHGLLAGSGDLTLTGGGLSSRGPALVVSNVTPNASTYTGNITLGNSTVANLFPVVTLWASNNLGSGTVTFVNGGQLVTHNNTSLANNLVFNTGPLPVGNANNQYTPINLKAWDAPMNLSGSVTLANNTTISANFANPNLQFQSPGDTGSFALAGPRNRNPIIFSGTIGESGGARSLNIIGPGVVVFSGNNTTGAYTGGTFVGFPAGTSQSQQGALIFANQNAIPATGTLQSGLLNVGGSAGYIGIADTAVASAGAFITFLSRIAPGSSGAVGLDSLDGANAPDGTPHVYNYNIDLTHFTTTAGGGIRLGTATSLILPGSITLTPQLGASYNFGNGGGKLYVQINLANQSTFSTTLVTSNSGAVPLQLFLQGSNTYTGNTQANNGFIIFDGASSIPASGTLTAFGGASNIGGSYLGFTNTTLGGNSINGATLTSGIFSQFNKAGTFGIIGFDSTNVASPITITNLDLSAFNNGVYVGTNSAAILTGTLTPTSVATTQPANALRLTATNGGRLQVDSSIAAPLSVVLGSFNSAPAYSDGTVILNGANTYSAGTLVNNFGYLNLVAGNNGAFGTGAIQLQPQGGIIGLAAGAPSVDLPNPITFLSSAVGTSTSGTPTLNLTGANDFVLSGAISGPARTAIFSGPGAGNIALSNASPLNVTVAGNNSGYYGDFLVQNGTLTFAGDNSPGHAQIQMNGAAGTIAFTSANPVVYGLTNQDGGGGTVSLGGSTHLTVDTINTDGTIGGEGNGSYQFEFGGSFVGASTSSLTVTNSGANGGKFLYMYGASPAFSGNVNITGQGALALGQKNSVGSGLITINAAQGGLALNTGVTLTNPIQFTAGGLAGLGTFAPSSVNGTLGGAITVGAGQIVFAGIPGDNHVTPGQLTLATNVIFADGGQFALGLQDPLAAEGFGSLAITGNLDLTSLSANGFIIQLSSLDATGQQGGFASTVVWGNSYSLLFLTAGSITSFNAANFGVDASQFQSGVIPNSNFSITNPDSTHLYLNFTAVPEPSTWALLAMGAGCLGLAAWRRRRAN